MLSEAMAKRLSYQINREIYSAYLYLGMAAYADSIDLKGFANWFKIQFKEELEHAEKIYDYLNQQGVRVLLEAIERPPQEFSSGKELFVKTLAHEKNVTNMIKSLAESARSENDKQTEEFLQWFIKEQVEEEAAPAKILEGINGKDGPLNTDSKLAARKRS